MCAIATKNELCYWTAHTCFKIALLLIEGQKNTQHVEGWSVPPAVSHNRAS